MDPENEVDVQKAIHRLVQGRTVVVVAHCLRTVVRADQIIVLDRGRVVEQGKHEELLNRKGLYARMWSIQEQMSGWRIG